jgi:hypothetical protein
VEGLPPENAEINASGKQEEFEGGQSRKTVMGDL